MKLDWIKCKAEGGGRRNPATHTPIRDPSLDAGLSGLSIKTSSNQPSTVNPHLWKRRFFLLPLAFHWVLLLLSLPFRGNSVFAPDVPQRHNLTSKVIPISLLSGLGRSRRHCTPLFSLDPATISATNRPPGSLQADLLPIISQNFLTSSTKPALRCWPDRRPALQQQL